MKNSYRLFVGHTEKECAPDPEEMHINATKIKSIKKRKTNDEKEMANNVKKGRVVDPQKDNKEEEKPVAVKVIKKSTTKLEKEGRKSKLMSKLKVKTLNKPRLLKMHKKMQLNNKTNGIVKTRKKTKKTTIVN